MMDIFLSLVNLYGVDQVSGTEQGEVKGNMEEGADCRGQYHSKI